MTLPSLNQDGLLPPGDYRLTIEGLRNSCLVSGDGVATEAWDSEWRRYLVDNLDTLVGQLWQADIGRIYVDGSFAEEKDHPNDVDGYFECDARRFLSGDLARELNELDPYKVWTWSRASRRPDPNSAKWQLPMWHRYRVELWPHYGNFSAIRDQFGHDLQFPSAFRLSRRAYRQKGIVQIVR